MLYSKLFPKARKIEFKDDLSINAKFLVQGGFIDQLMAGSWTLLPLGFRVVEKIKDIIREELNKTGAQELLMPLLHPREIWDQTGRWSDPDVQQIMYQFKDVHEKEYGLSFTHEEILMNLLGKHVQSYKDLPIALYHFSTKFRNEPRAKSGILRAREFMMKDLYSAHVSEADMYEYYNKVKEAYIKIFERMGLKVLVVEASGGVFTDKNSHEFQVLSDVGEDTIYHCDKCDFAENKEIFKGKGGDKCLNCEGTIQEAKSIEVGNIFPLGTKYSQNQKVLYNDRDGNLQNLWFASYGIGPTRVMGTLVELFHDDGGVIWPRSVAPFDAHLVSLGSEEGARKVYEALLENKIDILWDDRDVSAGEKFANADLIGLPYRLVVSEKTGDEVEIKRRESKETEILTLDEVITRLRQKGDA
jgi:prolyl-tRNA synthetase